MKEKPGEGKGELCSHYIYFVEELQDGNRVFLKRPAVLNKGFDFTVHIENQNFGKNRSTTMPSHKVILHDLAKKKKENPKQYKIVDGLIDDYFECRELDMDVVKKLKFKKGYPIETILKAIKWLFIEQDVTYWNWTGRNMLYDAICDNV